MKSSQWDKVKLPYCEQEHECLTLRAQGQKSEDGKMYVYNVSEFIFVYVTYFIRIWPSKCCLVEFGFRMISRLVPDGLRGQVSFKGKRE